MDEFGATDLHKSVSLIRSIVVSERPDLEQIFEEKLADAGYDDEHDYDVVVLHRSTESYSVTESFPRIVPGNYQEGPVEVSYDLPLAQIADFEIGKHQLDQLIVNSE